MRYKIVLILIVICLFMGILMFSFGLDNNSDVFKDMGIPSDHNDDWNNSGLTVTRASDYTILSSDSNSSRWYVANIKLKNNCVIEWDNHGKPNAKDYCLISDTNLKNEVPINFVKNLNITKDCHIKLVILNDTVIPYVDGVVKNPIVLKANADKGLLFRFQINPHGEDIEYSNFTIYNN